MAETAADLVDHVFPKGNGAGVGTLAAEAIAQIPLLPRRSDQSVTADLPRRSRNGEAILASITFGAIWDNDAMRLFSTRSAPLAGGYPLRVLSPPRLEVIWYIRQATLEYPGRDVLRFDAGDHCRGRKRVGRWGPPGATAVN